MGLAAGVRAVDAIGDALLGNCEATHALAEPPSFGGQHSYYAPQALVALALWGQTAELHSLAQGLAKKPLQAWWWNLVELPEIQAATQLGSGKPEVAIELL